MLKHYGVVPSKTQQTVAHTTLISENLVDLKFYDKNNNPIVDLNESVFKLENDILYFNFNWLPLEKKVIPLQKILDLKNENIAIDICFHDILGTTIYKVSYNQVKLDIKTDLSNFEYNSEICKKYLEVYMSYEHKEIIV